MFEFCNVFFFLRREKWCLFFLLFFLPWIHFSSLATFYIFTIHQPSSQKRDIFSLRTSYNSHSIFSLCNCKISLKELWFYRNYSKQEELFAKNIETVCINHQRFPKILNFGPGSLYTRFLQVYFASWLMDVSDFDIYYYMKRFCMFS